MRADIADSVITVEAAYDERDLIKQVPGARWNSRAKVWNLPLSWASCVALRGVFGERLEVGSELALWARYEHQERVEPATQLRGITAWPEHWDWTGDPRLYPFQRAGVYWLLLTRAGLLGDEMGLGKSIQALAALEQGHPRTAPALIVAPNSLKEAWAKHAETWAPSFTPYVVGGSVIKRRKVLATAAEDPNALVIVNYEATRIHSRLAPYGSVRLARCIDCDPRTGDPELPETKCQMHAKELNTVAWNAVVFDEVHRLQDPRALQTRACWAISHGDFDDPEMKFRWGLSGTPQASHPGTLWSVMHAIAPREYPVRSTFLDRYAQLAWNSFGGMDIIGLNPEHRDEFFSFFDPRFRRMQKAIVAPHLPRIVRHTRWVDMAPKQRKAYKEMAEGLMTSLGDDLLVAANRLVAETRLLQLASSYAEVERGDPPDDPKTWQVKLIEPSPKVDEVLEIATLLGEEPFAVCAESRQLIDLTEARLLKHAISCVRITGAESPAEREANKQRFERGEARVILFTVQAGGEGLDIPRATTLVRIGRSWRVLINIQTVHRIHRLSSTGDVVNIIDVVTRESNEEKQIVRLRVMEERLEEINRDRQSRAAAGIPADDLDAEEANILGSDLFTPADTAKDVIG